jgi:type II secretory pathway component PulK
MRALVGVPLVAIALSACAVLGIGPARSRVDLNSADAATIARLPGLTRDDAQRIVTNRPYVAVDDLRRRNIVGPAELAAIADRVTVGPPAPPDYLRSVPPQPEGP